MIPIVLTMLIYFSSQSILKINKMKFGALIFGVIYFLFISIFKSKYNLSLIYILPLLYLVSFFILSYFLYAFKSISSFKVFDEYPVIVYPGSIGVFWENSKIYNPSKIEIVFSILILIVPFFEIILISIYN